MKIEYSLELDDGSGELAFEWDSEKAAANLAKHGIRFEEAVTIFQDDVLMGQVDTSAGEYRVRSYGRLHNDAGRTITICVVHTERGDRTRIISARKATAHERKEFDVHFRQTLH